MNSTSDLPLECGRARRLMHARLDGDLMDAADAQALDAHLEACATCREAHDDLRQIQGALRGMQGPPLSEADFAAVLARTSRAPAPSRLRRLYDWRAVAAAALLAAALWSAWPSGPDQAEVDRAAAEARMVLMLTAKALSRTERAAVRDVITGEVSPALSRIPMNLPTAVQRKEL